MKKTFILLLSLIIFVVFSCEKGNIVGLRLDIGAQTSAKLVILDSLLEPVPLATVSLYKVTDSVELYISRSISDNKGLVCYYGLDTGAYIIRFLPDGLAVHSDSLLVHTSGMLHNEWTFPLHLMTIPSDKGHARLQVIDSLGNPISGESITLLNSVRQIISVTESDFRGVVKYFNLMPGDYTVLTSSRLDSISVDISPGQSQNWSLAVSHHIVQLSKIGWSVVDFSSQQNATNYAADKMIDNNPATFWNSSWSIVPRPTHPHIVTIDMGQSQAIKGFILQNATFESGGWPFKNFEMYVSIDNTSWTSVGIFQQGPRTNSFEQYHLLTNPVIARYFRLKTIDQWHTSAAATVTLAEIGVFN